MATPESCPCDALNAATDRIDKLEDRADRFEARLAKGETNFALIQQDLGYIKAKLDRKDRFNSQTIASIVQAICSLLLAYVATRIGLQ